MLDLNTGTLRLKRANVTLSPGLTQEDVRYSLPPERLTNTWQTSTGWTWFYLQETLYPMEGTSGLELCFTPEGHLNMFIIHPPKTSGGPAWSEEAGRQRKSICDRWLQKHCGVTLPDGFHGGNLSCTWGELSSFYDPRSGGSGVCVRYY